jgi:hypothetical protein
LNGLAGSLKPVLACLFEEDSSGQSKRFRLQKDNAHEDNYRGRTIQKDHGDSKKMAGEERLVFREH